MKTGNLDMLGLKILASLPVQYQAPLYAKLVQLGIGVEVAYYHQGSGQKATQDAEFGIPIAWDIDLLTGYPYHFFKKGRATFRLGEQARLAPSVLAWSLRDRQTPLLLVGWFAHLAWLVWLVRIMLHAPVMVMGDNTWEYFTETPKPAWRMALLKWLLQRTQAVFYMGARNRIFWKNLGVREAQLYFTPHSVDNERFAKEAERLLPQRRELCQRFKIDPDLPTFLFCGKLIPFKRPVQLLEAYLEAGLQEKAQLIYVGEGEQRGEIEARVRSNQLAHVHCLDFFNQSQMPLAYVLGEVLCLVSVRETWGLVVNEALACGRPVLVSDTAGSTDDLVGPENGWVAEDSGALAEMLRMAFSMKEKWLEMGRAGRTKVRDYSFEAMTAGISQALADQARRR